jgi:hypothetical protein
MLTIIELLLGFFIASLIAGVFLSTILNLEALGFDSGGGEDL